MTRPLFPYFRVESSRISPWFNPALSLRPRLIIFLTFPGIEYFSSSISRHKLYLLISTHSALITYFREESSKFSPWFNQAVSLRPRLIIFLTFSGIEYFSSSISRRKLYLLISTHSALITYFREESSKFSPWFNPAVSLRPRLIIFLTFSGIEYFSSSISRCKLYLLISTHSALITYFREVSSKFSP